MWMFYRRGIRRSAKHLSDYQDNSNKFSHAALSWVAWEDARHGLWPASCQLDAITDHWLEEAPFPLTTVNKKVRELARLRYENLETRQWVDSNVSITKQASTHFLSEYAPQLLLPSSEGGSDFISKLLKEDAWTERKTVYKKLAPQDVEKLQLLRESDAEKERQEEEEAMLKAQQAMEEEERMAREELAAPEKEKTLEERGRDKAKKRIDDGESTEDSEQWEWYHREDETTKSPMGAVVL